MSTSGSGSFGLSAGGAAPSASAGEEEARTSATTYRETSWIMGPPDRGRGRRSAREARRRRVSRRASPADGERKGHYSWCDTDDRARSGGGGPGEDGCA